MRHAGIRGLSRMHGSPQFKSFLSERLCFIMDPNHELGRWGTKMTEASKRYRLRVAGIERSLPIIEVASGLSIASFVILGDAELVGAAAPQLVDLLPEGVDYLMTAEAKGIPLAHEMARVMGASHYIVARKSIKPYMSHPLVEGVESITTQAGQSLCLDGEDAEKIRGKRIALVDDVISTGESIAAIERLAMEAGAKVVARVAILAEGAAAERDDIKFLERLPLFS